MLTLNRLTGGSPFYSESYNEILWKNKNCEINFNFREFGHRISPAGKIIFQVRLGCYNIDISKLFTHVYLFIYYYFDWTINVLAVDLMKKMLSKDPKQRISSQQALQHEWIITGGTIMSPQTNTPIYLLLAQENMRRFQQEYNNFIIFF